MNTAHNQILFYGPECYVFSNFSSFMVEYAGTLWPTAEHAYQAAKFTDPHILEQIKTTRSAHDALHFGHEHAENVRSDWNDIRLNVMKEILRAKLHQHPYVKKKLLETGDREIIEDSPRDSFWGWGPNKDGENNLGEIWMELRAEILEKN